MISAFGVDHGEISKIAASAALTGPQKITAGAKKLTEANISLSGIGRKTGRGLQHAGSWIERNPGKTGAALVGGGGGAAGVELNRRLPRKKKR